MSEWRDEVRKQILRYCDKNNTTKFDLHELLDFSENDLKNKFPENDTWEASIRRTLQELRDNSEVEFLGNGRYRRKALNISDDSIALPIAHTSINNKLQYSLTHYHDAKSESNWNHPIITLINSEIPSELEIKIGAECDNTGLENLDIQGSCGKGRMANIPWIGIFDKRVSDGPRDGLYVVYLFDTVEDRLFLTLNQGMTELKDNYGLATTKDILSARAEILREQVNLNQFKMTGIDLPEQLLTGRNKHYGNSTICYRSYDADQFPSQNEIVSDLCELVTAYQKIISNGFYDELISSFDDKQAVQRYPNNTSSKDDPSVWIEKTQVAGREYKQEGEYKLGNALMSPSRDEGGRKRYEAMREAEVGDIVLHLLQDQHQFAGVSVIDSDLNEDFEGPPTDRWTDEQQEQGGYLRWLRNYEGIEPHIHVYDDLLEHSEYEDELQEIRENSEKIFYDKRLSLNQGHYFTRCPDELAEILANESRHLRELLEKRGYQFETRPNPIPPANEYSGTENESKIEEATNDIRSRLERREDSQGWPIEGVAKGIIRDWTDTLRRSDIVAEKISSTDRVKCEQIVSLYEEHASEFDQLAEQIQSGTIEDSRLSPGQVVYIALFRELQDLAGESSNMNQVKFEKLLQGAHRGESGESLTPPNEPLAGIEIDKIERQLNKTGQLVFYGPPGTGKTYTAQRFARWWLNEQDEHTPSETQLETVTFHPSFSYEDFIEGLTAEKKDGEVVYEIKDGAFKKISQRAKQAYEHSRDSNKIEEIPRYVLIIDEINRGNLAQIFGETMTLLESDKRYDQENEVKISLAHSGDSFVVPPNLYVIGTMNTADRSIALVDAALRRRFRFISFPPNYKVIINDYDAFDNLDEVRTVAETDPDPYRSLVALSILALRGLNERIVDAPDLGKGKQIGHSYLMNLDNVDDVLDAWKYEILPLIEEYYFGQFARIREELFDGSGDRLFQWEQEEIADFTADELRRTLAGLEEISLAEPETEASEDTQYTIELLLNEGVIEAGTQLVFDESKVPDDADRAYDSSELFWRCEITGKTGQSDNVQWLHNDEQYSFSGLAQTILERISEHSEPVTGPDYWQHPEFEDRLLADLRIDVQSGQLVVDEQTTD